METRWIQDFVTLTEVRNFTRAAELRNVSQAAFSRRIRALEQWLGAPLVDRSCFPLRITEAGERFRPSAIALLSQLSDARAEASGEPAGNVLKIALSYTLASTHLSHWWPRWSEGLDVRLQVETGSVLDSMQALSEGGVDLVVAFIHASNPIAPDLSRHDRLVLGKERVRPYSAPSEPGGKEPMHRLPGTPETPARLLMYAPSVYFARVVESVLDSADQPVLGTKAVESAMTDVLAAMAQAGLGVAWLADGTLDGGRFPGLVPAGDERWSAEVEIVAFRLKHNGRGVLEQVWDRMSDAAS